MWNVRVAELCSGSNCSFGDDPSTPPSFTKVKSSGVSWVRGAVRTIRRSSLDFFNVTQVPRGLHEPHRACNLPGSARIQDRAAVSRVADQPRRLEYKAGLVVRAGAVGVAVRLDANG